MAFSFLDDRCWLNASGGPDVDGLQHNGPPLANLPQAVSPPILGLVVSVIRRIRHSGMLSQGHKWAEMTQKMIRTPLTSLQDPTGSDHPEERHRFKTKLEVITQQKGTFQYRSTTRLQTTTPVVQGPQAGAGRPGAIEVSEAANVADNLLEVEALFLQSRRVKTTPRHG